MLTLAALGLGLIHTRLSGQPRDALLVMNHGRVVGLLPTERLLAQLG